MLTQTTDLKSSVEPTSELQGAAEGYFKTLRECFGPNHPHVTELAQVACLTQAGRVNAAALYVYNFALLHTTDSMHLLPSFRKFMPGNWNTKDIIALEHEMEAIKYDQHEVHELCARVGLRLPFIPHRTVANPHIPRRHTWKVQKTNSAWRNFNRKTPTWKSELMLPQPLPNFPVSELRESTTAEEDDLVAPKSPLPPAIEFEDGDADAMQREDGNAKDAEHEVLAREEERKSLARKDAERAYLALLVYGAQKKAAEA